MTRAAAGWTLVLGTGADAAAQHVAAHHVSGNQVAVHHVAIDPLLDSAIQPAYGAANMAVDSALLETVRRSGQPVVRFYRWAPACLSFGRNQAALGIYDPDRAASLGIGLVRRPTGGLAVLHDHELTYSVSAPLDVFGGPRAAYTTINRALVEGLRTLGVAAGQAVDARPRAGAHASAVPCFQAAAAGEVVAGGRKLVGSAQRCERGIMLQHGSILLSGSQSRVRDLLSVRAPVDVPPTDAVDGTGDGSITLRDLLGTEPPLMDLVAALQSGFESVLGTRLAPRPLSADERGRVEELTAVYDADDWTWRR